MSVKENIDKAKEIGDRLRRVRMAQGKSQQQVADFMNTTPQNVSKWENNGVHDIDIIARLSEYLGQDLQSDEQDKEGTVGEVGKEILKQALLNKGRIVVEKLLDHLFGLDADRLNHEIFKLEEIGLCYRDQYKNFDGNDEDVVFITAKGVIFYINSDVRDLIDDTTLRNVVTYEKYLSFNSPEGEWLHHVEDGKTFTKFQDLIDSRPIEALLRSIKPNRYRSDYVAWLVQKYCTDLQCSTDEVDDIYREVPGDDLPLLYPVTNLLFYSEILYRMMYDFHNDECSAELRFIEDETQGAFSDAHMYSELFFEEALKNTSGVHHEFIEDCANSQFVRDFHGMRENLNKIRDSVCNSDEFGSRYAEIVDESDEPLSDMVKQLYHNRRDFNEKLYQENVEKYGSIYPSDWFSEDEIKDFISKYVKPASTPEEKEIDAILAKINELDPESLAYYEFPHAWEKNGISQMVRNIYHIPEYNVFDESLDHRNYFY